MLSRATQNVGLPHETEASPAPFDTCIGPVNRKEPGGVGMVEEGVVARSGRGRLHWRARGWKWRSVRLKCRHNWPRPRPRQHRRGPGTTTLSASQLALEGSIDGSHSGPDGVHRPFCPARFGWLAGDPTAEHRADQHLEGQVEVGVLRGAGRARRARSRRDGRSPSGAHHPLAVEVEGTRVLPHADQRPHHLEATLGVPPVEIVQVGDQVAGAGRRRDPRPGATCCCRRWPR